MKKIALAFAALAFAATAFAVEQRTPEQIARSRARRMAALAAKGGLVTKPQSGNLVRIVNAQKSVATDFIRQVAKDACTGFRVGLEVSDMEAGQNPFEDVEKALKLPKTGIALLVVNDPKLPVLLSAPENAWAILNVRTLDEDMPPRNVLDLRVRRELCRGLASACGVGLSYNRPCVMEPVYSKTDLDSLKMNMLGPEAISKMLDAAKLRGVMPTKVATYRQACAEGWAPSPTNDVQKAIWNEVHSVPKNPMKIEFDPKKGR